MTRINHHNQEVIEELNHVNIITYYANKDVDGDYENIYTTKADLEQDYPAIGSNFLNGVGVVFKQTGMSPDSAEDWYDTLEEARAYARELEEEIRSEQGSRTFPRTSELRHMINPEPMTAGQLRETLNRLYEQDAKNDNLVLGIATADAMTEGYHVGIQTVSVGFDWDMGTLVVHPAKDLLTKELLD